MHIYVFITSSRTHRERDGNQWVREERSRLEVDVPSSVAMLPLRKAGHSFPQNYVVSHSYQWFRRGRLEVWWTPPSLVVTYRCTAGHLFLHSCSDLYPFVPNRFEEDISEWWTRSTWTTSSVLTSQAAILGSRKAEHSSSTWGLGALLCVTGFFFLTDLKKRIQIFHGKHCSFLTDRKNVFIPYNNYVCK